MHLIVVKIDHKFYSLYHITTPHKIHLSSKDLIVYFEKKITFHNRIFFDLILLYQILIFVSYLIKLFSAYYFHQQESFLIINFIKICELHFDLD
jgi:hypothetical protein